MTDILPDTRQYILCNELGLVLWRSRPIVSNTKSADVAVRPSFKKPKMPEMSGTARQEKQRTDEEGAGGTERKGIGQKSAEKREQKNPPDSPDSLTAGHTQADPDPLPEQQARVTTVATTTPAAENPEPTVPLDPTPETSAGAASDPKENHENESSFKLRALSFAGTGVLYFPDNNFATSNLVENMFVKCGADITAIKTADLEWPPAEHFSRAGYPAVSSKSACRGFLNGVGCSFAVVMGEDAENILKGVTDIKYVRTDSPAELLQEPEKRKVAWQILEPLRKKLTETPS